MAAFICALDAVVVCVDRFSHELRLFCELKTHRVPRDHVGLRSAIMNMRGTVLAAHRPAHVSTKGAAVSFCAALPCKTEEKTRPCSLVFLCAYSLTMRYPTPTWVCAAVPFAQRYHEHARDGVCGSPSCACEHEGRGYIFWRSVAVQNRIKDDAMRPRLCMCLQLDHAVSHAHMGLYELRVRRPRLYLLAQRRHEHAQRGDVAVKSGAPDFAR